MEKRTTIMVVAVVAIAIIVVGYWYSTLGAQSLAGTIEIDGSSTVFPITQAVAEEFQNEYPDVRVNVGVSGTGGGFKRFQVGETDINDASRPIKSSEAEECAKKQRRIHRIHNCYRWISGHGQSRKHLGRLLDSRRTKYDLETR
jgi:phosphate transport system substrate-binding protein